MHARKKSGNEDPIQYPQWSLKHARGNMEYGREESWADSKWTKIPVQVNGMLFSWRELM